MIVHSSENKSGIWRFVPVYSQDSDRQKKMQVVIELVIYCEKFDVPQTGWVLDLVDQ